MSLFGNIYLNPRSPNTESDLSLLGHVIGFLSTCCASETNNAIQQMLCLCMELERIAKYTLDESERQPSSCNAHQRGTIGDDDTKDGLADLYTGLDFQAIKSAQDIFSDDNSYV